jgi:AsmA-like protein
MSMTAQARRFGALVKRHGRRNILIVLTLLLISAAILLSVATRLTPHVRDRAVAALNERFQSDVELASLQVSVFPRPEVTGAGLSLRHNGRTDVPPLIKIGTYSAGAGLFGLFTSPLHLRTVELEQLVITIPPGGLREPGNPANSAPRDAGPPAAASPSRGSQPSRLVVNRIVSRGARLVIVPRDRGKQPRIFDIHDVVMHGLGDRDGAPFEATLTNPKPVGLITTRGTFGPWRGDEPGLTPVRGTYAFKNANLNTIKGIAGILSSTGEYSGVLERIEVKGETDTPDFAVDVAAQPVPLKTRFHAIVDGTNGNTWLEQVQARVLETVIVAKGAVVRTQDVKGRKVTLDVKIDEGRIEDVLRLALKARTPLMTGRMKLDTKFLLPAGDRDVVDKLELEGTFRLDQARFTNVNVQQRIDTLSQRGKGKTEDDGRSVVSNFSGRFALRNGTLSFADLSFAVPGALVQLAGTFSLKGETLDFTGHLLLDASLAETTTGVKSVLARIAQPLFRRPGGGSKLPIRISGPWAKPEFGLDVKRALTPGN